MSCDVEALAIVCVRSFDVAGSGAWKIGVEVAAVGPFGCRPDWVGDGTPEAPGSEGRPGADEAENLISPEGADRNSDAEDAWTWPVNDDASTGRTVG